jgi:hypothetical protein
MAADDDNTAGVVQRIQQQAVEVRVLRLVLSALAAPFYVAGVVVAVVWLAVVWCIAAAQVGFVDVRARRGDR